MLNKLERYERILGPLYRLAREGKTEGEREAARNRIEAISQKLRDKGLDDINKELNRQLEIIKQQEKKRRAAERQKEELRRREEEARKEQLRKKEELKWKRRAERKQKECIKRDEKFAMRANWIYHMLQNSEKMET